ncbi:MAG TPA: apolipoprotein N-acyltransferase [Acidimicrobiales bacterium]|nr:apolipoprotein N-acyltransferase [Acidimicrobiales bacterium]
MSPRRRQACEPRHRRALRWCLAAAAGGAWAASLPPLGWWPLGILGAALLATSVRAGGVGARAGRGLLAGLVQYGIGLAFVLAFSGLGYAVLVLAEALFPAAACALAPRRARPVALASALTLAELARQAVPFGGLPLAGLALGQAGGPLAPLARLGGPVAAAAGAYLAGTCLEAAAHGLLARGRGGLRRWRVQLAGGLVGTAAVAAAAGLGAAIGAGPALGHLEVALVQGGGRRGTSALEVPAARVLGATLAETSRIERPVDLVVWPEDVVALPGPLDASPARELLAGVARRTRATVLAGVTELVGRHRFTNAVVAFSPTGRLVGRVEKAHLVPFGEYVPWRSVVSKVADLAAVPRDAIAGHGTGMLATPAGRLAVLISYEAFFADRARSGVDAGGDLLVVATNTASYRSSQVPAQELAASRLDAVSTGRDLVQAATVGYSAIVAPDGDVRARSALGSPALVVGRVALRGGRTPFDRFGELPLVLLGALGLVAGLVRSAPGLLAQGASRTSAEASASPRAVRESGTTKSTLLKSTNLPTHSSP